MISRASSPENPLVISVSLPVRSTMIRSGSPAFVIADLNPSAIERTDTKTITTPAMPMMATIGGAGPLADRAQVDAGDGNDLGQHRSAPAQRVNDFEAARLQRRHHAGHQAEHQHQHDAEHDVLRREVEDREQAAGWIALRDDQPGQRQTRASRRAPLPASTREAPSPRTLRSLNPRVFRIASSLVRSRIDCAIALPATNRMKSDHHRGNRRS